MKLALLEFDLFIHGSASLKDKRSVVKSLKDRLHREHMVSVAEVGLLDHLGVARLGLAAVGSDAKYLSGLLDRIIEKLRAMDDAELGELRREIFDPDDAGWDERAEDGSPLWTPEESRGAGDDTGTRPE
jgi:uncharacterized protein YlxP (DUF503 family)